MRPKQTQDRFSHVFHVLGTSLTAWDGCRPEPGEPGLMTFWLGGGHLRNSQFRSGQMLARLTARGVNNHKQHYYGPILIG